MTQKTHVKYWTLFFDDFPTAESFMESEEQRLGTYGVICKKEELKMLKNGDWYWQICFNKPMYETEMKSMMGDRPMRCRPTN